MGHTDRTGSGKRHFSEQPSTPQTTTMEEPMKVSTTQPKPTAMNSIQKKNNVEQEVGTG